MYAPFELADKPTFAQLFFLALVAGLTTKHLAYQESGRCAVIAGGITLPLYFCHRFSFEAKFDVLLTAFVRSILISWFVTCVTSLFASVCLLISKKIGERQAFAEAKRKVEERERERELERQRKLAEQSNRPPPPPPMSAKEKAEAFARQAREEYDIEMDLIRSLPLDDDERSVLEMDAKIKLLRKLKGRQ